MKKIFYWITRILAILEGIVVILDVVRGEIKTLTFIEAIIAIILICASSIIGENINKEKVKEIQNNNGVIPLKQTEKSEDMKQPQKQEKINIDKYVLPAVILLACLILGGFYYATQLSKQRSIENQQQTKLEEDKKAEEAKKLEAETNKQKLETCLSDAKKSYQEFWNKECRRLGRQEGTLGDVPARITKKEACALPKDIARRADDLLRDKRDLCLKLYPQK